MSEARLPLFCPSKLLLALFRRDRSNAHYLHWAYSFYFWQSRSRSRWTRGILALLIWPPVLLACQAQLLPRLGPKVKAMTGKGLFRQWVEQLQVAWLWSINPMEYYSFELFDDDRRARAGAYLLRHQFKGGLHNILECDVDPRHNTRHTINNKAKFALYCKERGISAVEPLLVVQLDGRLMFYGSADGHLPKQDLFVKPINSKGGRGCERWRYDGEGYRNGDGTTKTEAELLDHLYDLTFVRLFKDYFKRREYLVQPCLGNHPDLADLSTGALITARIMTCRDETGIPRIGFGVMKIVTGRSAVVDNFHAGGWVSAIDVASGRLGPATDSGLKKPGTWLDRHPVSGAQINGRRLPCWTDVVALVEAAHAHFPDRIGIGWDVAVTPSGPCIIEANMQWGLDMVQRTHRQPVGDSRFARMYAHHIRSALAAVNAGTARKLLARGEPRPERVPYPAPAAVLTIARTSAPAAASPSVWRKLLDMPLRLFWMAWGSAFLVLCGALTGTAWLVTASEHWPTSAMVTARVASALVVALALYAGFRLALLGTASLQRVLARNLAIVIDMELRELRASVAARASSLEQMPQAAGAQISAAIPALEIPAFFGKRADIRRLLGQPTEQSLRQLLDSLQSYNAAVRQLAGPMPASDVEAAHQKLAYLRSKIASIAEQVSLAANALTPLRRAAI